MRIVYEVQKSSVELEDGQRHSPDVDFDGEDIRVVTRALRSERERCEPWERHALNRMIDLLEREGD